MDMNAAITEEHIHRYLRSLQTAHPPLAASVIDAGVSLLGHGFNNRLYALHTRDHAYVMKIYPRGREERLWREYEALTLLEPVDAIPRGYWADPNAAFIEAPVLITEKVEGKPILEAGIEMKDLEQLADIWKQVHRRDRIPQALLRTPTGPARPGDCVTYIERAVYTLSQTVSDREPRFREAVNRLTDIVRGLHTLDLHESLWKNHTVTLCQTDCRPANVLKDEAGRVKLVDWEHAGMMDPAYEVAGFFQRPEAAAITPPQRDHAIRRYCDAGGDPFSYQKINVYLTLLPVQWVARLLSLIGADRAPMTQPWVVPATNEELWRDVDRYIGLAGETVGLSLLR